MTMPFYDYDHRSSSFLHTATNRGRRRAAVGRIREFEAIDALLEAQQIEVLNRATDQADSFRMRVIGQAIAQEVFVEMTEMPAEEGADIIARTMEYLEMFEPKTFMPTNEEEI